MVTCRLYLFPIKRDHKAATVERKLTQIGAQSTGIQAFNPFFKKVSPIHFCSLAINGC